MKRKNEKVPGFDEIIFENRNKEYGAYDLRKHYNSTECFSILGGVFLFTLLLIIITFTIEDPADASDGPRGVIIKLDPVVPDINKLKPEDPPKPVISQAQTRLVEPVVVDDTAEITTTIMITDDLIDSVRNRNVSDTVTVFNDPNPVIPAEPEPRNFVEEMPTFPGGSEALLRLISVSIKYPQEAVDNGIQGRVTLRFVVSSDGSVKRVEILRGVHPVLDKEAIRVVSALPKWKPGKQNGKAVPVWFSVPVNFKLKYN